MPGQVLASSLATQLIMNGSSGKAAGVPESLSLLWEALPRSQAAGSARLLQAAGE